jgi:DNA polymerase-3 subunit delta'
LIENIERMNSSAMNAFLKTCEEPLSNRIILATTSNKTAILDTILSRAITIPFYESSYEELQEYCITHDLFKTVPELKDISCFMSM